MGSQRLNQMGVKRKAPGDDKAQADKYQRTNAKSPGKFKVPRLPPAKRQLLATQQPSTSTSQRSYSEAVTSSYKSPFSYSQSTSSKFLNSTFGTQKQQYSGSTSSGLAQTQQGREDKFSNPAPYRGMADVKPEKASKGDNPRGAEETGNTAKIRMHNSTILISSCLADVVEANKARTKAKMEVIPKVNKAQGDTIEKGLKEAIDTAGSSNTGKDLHVIRWMTHNLPQHAECATKPKIDPIRHRWQHHTPYGRTYSIKAEVKISVTCQPLPRSPWYSLCIQPSDWRTLDLVIHHERKSLIAYFFMLTCPANRFPKTQRRGAPEKFEISAI
uniref:Uncharacterized protein n=1 Tax=Romanomermis culicivorax TaxID=13658 RepID=A0A915IDF3_ROMCU